MVKRKRHHELPEDRSINMTPMIDVVFQLILFFMLTSNLVKPNQIELDLPESTSGVKAADVTALVVTFQSRTGATEIKLNGEPVADLASLGPAMKTLAQDQPNPRVDLRIDKGSPYQDVIALMDTVRDAGFPKFSLLTLAPDTTTPRR